MVVEKNIPPGSGLVTFNVQEAQLVNEMISMNNELIAEINQREKHILAIKEVKDIIHKMKANRNLQTNKILGNTIVIPMGRKETLTLLQDRRKTLEDALALIEDQIRHRTNLYIEGVMRVYNTLESKMKIHGLTEEDMHPVDGVRYELASQLEDEKKRVGK